MSQDQTSIICIDLKSFYASVECVERGLDPFKANLVVADPTRSKSTICLAITPAMKSLGIKNRCRIHEIPDCVKYITAMPRMQLYMDYSAKIYGIYLRYVSKEDIHVYSVDECFIDVTNYLQLYHLTAKEMAVKLMQEVMEETGITATAGVGTNLYLAKIAMDIVAKHVDDHIGILDEFSYREQLWDHKPLSDFWRIGSRTEKKLAGYGIHTMGDIAMASLRSEDWLYKMFGIDAELLIDHAWGYETCRMSDIKNYHSEEHSLSNGQVLMRNYSFDEALVIVREMTDNLVLDLFEKGLVTSSLTLWIAYDHRYEHEACIGFFYSLTNWNGIVGSDIKFVGFQNFIDIFTRDDSFVHAFLFTALFSVCAVVLVNLVGFALALLVTQKFRGATLLRGIFFMPNMIGGLLLGFTWQFIFISIFEAFSKKTGIAAFSGWLSNPETGFIGLLILTVWQMSGYMMIVYIAQIQQIPESVKEAARIDGANSWQLMRYIILPLMMPAFTIGLFLSISSSFKMFDQNLALTQGGPYKSTEMIALNIYNSAFGANEFGFAQAKAIVFLIIVAGIGVTQLVITKRKEVEM